MLLIQPYTDRAAVDREISVSLSVDAHLSVNMTESIVESLACVLFTDWSK